MQRDTSLDITAIILTKDEELHIERCIKSVQRVCKKVLVVDSYSTDSTCQIAEGLGARVVQHPFENQAKQFNWAIDNIQISTEWIWRVDADEILEDSLVNLAKKELPTLTEERNVNGIYVNKKIVFMGRPLLHGGWYPAQQIKIIRTGFGRSEDKMMDEHLIVTSGETVSWDGDQTDWNLKPLDWWWNKHRGYAKREAQMQVMMAEHPESDNAADEVKGKLFGTNAEWKRWMKNLYGHCPRYLRAIVYFISRYFLMGGFLDGYAGWYWHTRQGLMYRWMVDREIGKLKRSNWHAEIS
jgi:glycosyltransferase involved in cell wall biosynthesis